MASKGVKSNPLCKREYIAVMEWRRRFISSIFTIDHTQYCPSDAIRGFLVVLIGCIFLWEEPVSMGVFNLVGLIIALGNLGGPSLVQKLKFSLVILATEIFTAFVSSLYSVYRDKIWYLIFPLAFVLSLVGGLMCTSALGVIVNLLITGHFAVFIGMQPTNVGEFVAWAAAGGSVSFVICQIPELLGFLSGQRSDLFKLWNSFGRGMLSYTSDLKHMDDMLDNWKPGDHVQDDPFVGQYAANKILEMHKLTKGKNNHVTRDIMEERIITLVKTADLTRSLMACLLVDAKARTEEVFELKHAVGRVAERIAILCEFPILFYVPAFRRWAIGSLDTMDTNVSKAIASFEEKGDEYALYVQLIRSLQKSTSLAAHAVMDKPWTRGKTSTSSDERAISLDGLPKLALKNRAMWIYSIRKSIVLTVCYLAVVYDVPHGFWLPMTIAFISSPAPFGYIVIKVTMRMIATVFGCLLGLVLLKLYFSRVAVTILLPLYGAGCIICFFSNYIWGMMFVVAFIFVSDVSLGMGFVELTVYRLLATVIGGVGYILSLLVFRPHETDMVGKKLAAQTRAVLDYAKEVMVVYNNSAEIGDDTVDNTTSPASFDKNPILYEKRVAMIRARLATVACLTESIGTPRRQGYYRVEPHSLAPAIILELIIIIREPFLIQQEFNDGVNASFITEEALELLELLAKRLEADVDVESDQEEMTASVLASGGLFGEAIVRAHKKLDLAGL